MKKILVILTIFIVALLIPTQAYAVELEPFVNSANGTVTPNPEAWLKEVWDSEQLLTGNRLLVPQEEYSWHLKLVEPDNIPIIYEPPIYRKFMFRFWWLWMYER